MSAPFFDKSGTATVFPGDRVIIKQPDGKHTFAFLRRVWMYLMSDGTWIPMGEIQYHETINAIPTAQMTKCVRWLGDDYVSLAALEMNQLPHANQLVLVWSNKRRQFINCIAKAIDFDVCLIEYASKQFEVATNDVYIMVTRRDSI